MPGPLSMPISMIRPEDIVMILLATAVKGAVLLLLAWATTALLMRRSSAAARHMVWLLVFCALLLLPAISAAVPRWHVLPQWPHAQADGPSHPIALHPLPTITGFDAARPTPATSEGLPAESGSLAWLWLAGVAIALVPLLLARFSIGALQRTARALDGRWDALLRQVMSDLGVRRRIVLCESPRCTMPMNLGIVAPRVVLPRECHPWDAPRRRMVLLHEVAHIKRCDCLWQLLAQLACALHWYNPLVWLAARKMRAERERACDDLVLAAGAPRCDYAEQLLQIASSFRPRPVFAAAAIAMARPGPLEGRLAAILDPGRNRRRLTWAGTFGVILLLAALVVPIAALQTAAQPASAGPPAPSAPLTPPVPPHAATAPATHPYLRPPPTLDELLAALHLTPQQRASADQALDAAGQRWRDYWTKHQKELGAIRDQSKAARQARDEAKWEQLNTRYKEITQQWPRAAQAADELEGVLTAAQREQFKAGRGRFLSALSGRWHQSLPKRADADPNESCTACHMVWYRQR